MKRRSLGYRGDETARGEERSSEKAVGEAGSGIRVLAMRKEAGKASCFRG